MNSTKNSSDNVIFQTNLLQALQKNKVIQTQLTEFQRSCYIQFLKDIQDYNLKEKYNRELLYKWKKENYVRQLKRKLQEYTRKRFGVKDSYYEYQVKNIDSVIAGEQALVIPPSEEKRRLNINAKYLQFLRNNPIQESSSSIHTVKSANASFYRNTIEKDEDEPDIRDVSNTWERIHAQSAVGTRQKQSKPLPTIQRSPTTNEIKQTEAVAKNPILPSVAVVSSVIVTSTPELVNSSFHEKTHRSPRTIAKHRPNDVGLPDGIEPLLVSSETFDKQICADLVAMRSVRRPRKNPSELNQVYETRKRIYQINKRAINSQIHQKNYKLQKNIQFNQQKQMNSTVYENLLVKANENVQQVSHDKKLNNKK